MNANSTPIPFGGAQLTTSAVFDDLRNFKSFNLREVGRGGGGRTRPPNYKVPWNEGVAAAHQIQLLILLTRAVFPAGCAGRREILGPPNVGSLIFKKEPATSPE